MCTNFGVKFFADNTCLFMDDTNVFLSAVATVLALGVVMNLCVGEHIQHNCLSCG